jgi:hypothetical protein
LESSSAESPVAHCQSQSRLRPRVAPESSAFCRQSPWTSYARQTHDLDAVRSLSPQGVPVPRAVVDWGGGVSLRDSRSSSAAQGQLPTSGSHHRGSLIQLQLQLQLHHLLPANPSQTSYIISQDLRGGHGSLREAATPCPARNRRLEYAAA